MRKNDILLQMIVDDLTRCGEKMKIESACEGRIVTATSEKISGVSFYFRADDYNQGPRGWSHVSVLFGEPPRYERNHGDLPQLLDKCQICPSFFLFVEKVDPACLEKLANEFAERIFESACFYRQIVKSCGERLMALTERLKQYLRDARREFYRREAEVLINESGQ